MEIYGIEILREGKNSLWYVGKSSRSSEVRFKEHLNGATQKVDQAIKKYGQDATKLHIFCKDIEDEAELNRLEVLYIQLMETYVGDKKGGLNMTRGAEGARKYNIDKEELQGYIDEGLSETEICTRLGNLNPVTLKNWMKSFGIERKSLFAQYEDVIRVMILEGKTITEISVATGIQSDRLGKALKIAGLKAVRQKPTKVSNDQILEVKQLTEEGKSSREIERLTKIHVTTVKNIQKRLGIKSTLKGGRGSSKNGTVITPEFIVKVLELRATGLSLSTVSRELGCSLMTVCNIEKGKYDHLK